MHLQTDSSRYTPMQHLCMIAVRGAPSFRSGFPRILFYFPYSFTAGYSLDALNCLGSDLEFFVGRDNEHLHR